MRFPYIKKMHLALLRSCPEDFTVTVEREGRKLVTVTNCFDRDYCPPWLIYEIVSPFGFTTEQA